MPTKTDRELRQTHRALVELPKVSFFKTSPEAFLREVALLLENKAFLPGECIVKQGDIGDCMYFITDGRVEVLVNDEQVATIGSGGLFGEMALVYDAPRNATVRTLEHCGAYRLSKANFDVLRNKHRHFDHAVRNIAQVRLFAASLPKIAEDASSVFPYMAAAV